MLSIAMWSHRIKGLKHSKWLFKSHITNDIGHSSLWGNTEKNPIAIGQGQRFEKRKWLDCLHIWIQGEWLEGSLENAVGQVKTCAAHMCGREMPLKGELEVHIESMFVWTHLVYIIASLLPRSLLSPCRHISTLLYSGVRTQGLCCSICITLSQLLCVCSVRCMAGLRYKLVPSGSCSKWILVIGLQ